MIKVTAVPKIKKDELPDADIFISADTSSIDEICNRLVNFPNIFKVETCLGQFNIIIGIQSVTQKDLYNFIKNELLNIPGVNDTETVIIGEFKK